MTSVKREVRYVHVVVVQKRAEKCTKKHGARAKKVVVLLIKPIVFLKFSLPSASLDLKVPNIGAALQTSLAEVKIRLRRRLGFFLKPQHGNVFN